MRKCDRTTLTTDMTNIAPRERMKRFYRAVEHGDMDNVRKYLTPDLINKVQILRDEHKIPLHLAAEKGHFEVVHFLVENGVDVDAMDERLTTACIRAVVNNNHKIACLLASHGADIRWKDMFGRSAYDCYTDAIEQEELRIARISYDHRNDID